jgi:hypothetical protein
VRVGEGHPQLYGTRFHGSLQPLPIEDQMRVDEQRAEVSSPPLAEYVDQMRQVNSQQRPWPEQQAEIKRLLAQLPASAEYEEYVAHLKCFLDRTT